MDCSLREAVLKANPTPGTDTIMLAAGTYTLTIPRQQNKSTAPPRGYDAEAIQDFRHVGGSTVVANGGPMLRSVEGRLDRHYSQDRLLFRRFLRMNRSGL